MGFLSRTVVASGLAAAVTFGARRSLDSSAPGGAERWTRTNHRGEPISLMEGPAVAAGLAASSLVAGSSKFTERLAQAAACAGAAAFGLYDDLEEDTSIRAKGLKGHLGELAKGNLTTGGLKIIGIGASAGVAALIGNSRKKKRGAFDVVLDTVIIAGSANLWNLLDLRPGRALKAAVIASAPLLLTGSSAAGSVVGASAAAFPGDLGERDMLGDSGANALGALIGTAFTQRSCRVLRLGGAAGIIYLTLASEKVSFSQVIADNEWLNRIDMFGRRPAMPPVDEPSTDGADGDALT